jgi:tRNA dimethylallyltransferase
MIPSTPAMADPLALNPLVIVMGPTASGKTPLALALSEGLPTGGECIVADSMQIYRGMDIGTASPTAEERARSPHHLLDIAEPCADGFTVADFALCANEAIEAIRSRGRTPIVVGGTHLYIRALLEGVFDGPKGDPEIRAALEQTDTNALRVELEACDPAASEQIHVNDRRRSIRAIEVFRLTGVPISVHQSQWAATIEPRDDALIIGLEWATDRLNRRINERVRTMMANGFLDEVKRLRCTPMGRQASEAVGYRELSSVLEGSVALDDAVEAIKIRSRQYAKQQRTWLRRFRATPRSLWLTADDRSTADLAGEALGWIEAQNQP